MIKNMQQIQIINLIEYEKISQDEDTAKEKYYLIFYHINSYYSSPSL